MCRVEFNIFKFNFACWLCVCAIEFLCQIHAPSDPGAENYIKTIHGHSASSNSGEPSIFSSARAAQEEQNQLLSWSFDFDTHMLRCCWKMNALRRSLLHSGVQRVFVRPCSSTNGPNGSMVGIVGVPFEKGQVFFDAVNSVFGNA